MRQTTFTRINGDRIAIRRAGSHWQVRYYRATPIRGHWLRKWFAPPEVFQSEFRQLSEIHQVLHNQRCGLSRAESQRLNVWLTTLEHQP